MNDAEIIDLLYEELSNTYDTIRVIDEGMTFDGILDELDDLKYRLMDVLGKVDLEA